MFLARSIILVVGTLSTALAACTKSVTVSAGGTCYATWTGNGKSESTFYSLNPGVNCGNLKIGQQLCVAGSAGGGGGGGGRDKEVLDKTIFLEARGEPREGQIGVAWVIKNRARANRGYWGGSSIAGVCLQRFQFEPWNDKRPEDVHPENGDGAGIYRDIQGWSQGVLDGSVPDPSGGAVYFNNPDKEGPLENRIRGIVKTRVIGGHHFYREA